MHINLFPESETQITLNLPGKEEPITIDALDIDFMLTEVYTETDSEPSISEVIAAMVDKFEKAYKFRMSKMSMDALLNAKKELLLKVKKNSYLESKPASTTESPQETQESS